MSVTIRPYRRGGWEVDVRVVMPDGSLTRQRRKAPVSTKSGAMRWGLARERELLIEGTPKPRKEVPTLKEFGPRFLKGYAEANRHKPSGIQAKETIIRVHLLPALGSRKLDKISNKDVQRLKNRLSGKAAKTVNNVLTVLSTMLKVAVEWEILERVPCTIRLLKVSRKEAQFHDFDQYARLVEASRSVDERALLAVLLGGDAGLRCGEMSALRWTDVDLTKRQLHVGRSNWRGIITSPKGGRSRRVPMTKRLASALQRHRHLRSNLVLCHADGSPLNEKDVQRLVRLSARGADLENQGVHILRHTFCSHLAMRGAPARAIQEVAGHRNLSTTERYMHLSPAAVDAAIRLLEDPAPGSRFGDMLETEGSEIPKCNSCNS